MDSVNDALNRLGTTISRGRMQISSNIDADENNGLCAICGQQSICDGLGVIRYDVPVDDKRFGKLFRCPNNPPEQDVARQERLRKLSQMDVLRDKDFSQFVINESMLKASEAQSLHMALTMAARFAEHPEGWLLLEGTYGCGKTHLAAAVGNERLRHGDLVLFITTPDLLDHLRSTFGPSSEAGYDEMFDRIRSAQLLILDDLGAENASAWAQEKLFQLLNHRYNHQLPTVITTNADLDTLDPRIRSRLLDNTLIRRCKITAPDYRTAARNQHEQISSLALYGEMTFESFNAVHNLAAAERSNLNLAQQAALDYARQPQNWLLFTGPFATGKTHLAASIAHEQQAQGVDVLFITVPDLLDHLKVTFSPNAPVSFDQRFQMVRNTPLLVLDDLSNEGSTWAREKLFQILDYRYITRRPTVLTTSKPIEELDGRIRSRLLDKRICRIIALTGPDYPSRLNRR